jgi:hypothetical protein
MYLMTLAAGAAGAAIFSLAVLVLYCMDLRDGRWMVASGWVSAAFAGAYVAVVPLAQGVAPHWSVVALSISLAVCGWLNVKTLLRQATTRSPWPRAATFAGAGAMAGAVALLTPANAAREREMQPAVKRAAAIPTERETSPGVHRAKVG